MALRTEVQNWRWAGVPFYLRTGKRLAERDSHIVVNFRDVPHPIFPGTRQANKLVIKLQPEDGLELHLLAVKGSGGNELLSPVSLDLDFDKAFPSERVGGYERLLLDALAGRLNLFVRSDEQEQAWRWVEPVLDAWAQRPHRPAPLRRRQLGTGRGQRDGGARRLHLGRGTVVMAAPRRMTTWVDPPSERPGAPARGLR